MAIYNTEALLKTMPKVTDYRFNKESRELDKVEVEVPTFVDVDGILHVSMGTEVVVGDYYGEFTGGYPFIIEPLELWAENQGLIWEWVHPGAIALFE